MKTVCLNFQLLNKKKYNHHGNTGWEVYDNVLFNQFIVLIIVNKQFKILTNTLLVVPLSCF